MERLRPTTWMLLLILLSAALILCTLGYAGRREKDAQIRKSAEEREARFAAATTVEVWAAGYRSSDGSFCGACSPNPTRLYSTSDPDEVRDVLAHFRFRRRVNDEPEVGVCGFITIDFMRDGKILHSTNLKSARLEPESWSWVDSWLSQRDLVNKAAAVLSGPRKNR